MAEEVTVEPPASVAVTDQVTPRRFLRRDSATRNVVSRIVESMSATPASSITSTR
jgi:hypothetical protein